MENLFLEGRELLLKVNEYSFASPGVILKKCGYVGNWSFAVKNSRRSFVRNFAKAFLESGNDKFKEKKGEELKSSYLELREKKQLKIFPESFIDGYSRWVSTLIMLGKPYFNDSGNFKLGNKILKDELVELGLSSEIIETYKNPFNKSDISSKDLIKEKFPGINFDESLFDDDLLRKVESLNGFTRRDIAIECGYKKLDSNGIGYRPNLSSFNIALSLAKKKNNLNVSTNVPFEGRYIPYSNIFSLKNDTDLSESKLNPNEFNPNLKSTKTDREIIPFSGFQEWMENETNLSSTTIQSYLSAISIINKDLLEDDYIDIPLEEINSSKKLVEIKSNYFSIEKNRLFDQKCNRRYSAAFTKFILFKSTHQEQLKEEEQKQYSQNKNQEFNIFSNDKNIEKREKLSGQKLKKKVIEMFHNSLSENSICIRAGYPIENIGSFRRAFSKSANVTFGPLLRMMKELDKNESILASSISTSEKNQLFIEREIATSISNRRVRDTKFRKKVLALHGRKCACCEIRMEKLLEAAHIIPVTNNGTDHPSNGIPLCPTHHTAFDELLFTFDPNDLSVKVSNEIKKSDLNITQNNLSSLTDLEALKVREEFFLNGSF